MGWGVSTYSIGFGEIAQELSPATEPCTGRNAAISAVNLVLVALRYYATGTKRQKYVFVAIE